MNKKLYMRITSIFLTLMMIFTGSCCYAIPPDQRAALIEHLEEMSVLCATVANFCDKQQYRCADNDTEAAEGAPVLSYAALDDVWRVFSFAESGATELGSFKIAGGSVLGLGVGYYIQRIVCDARPPKWVCFGAMPIGQLDYTAIRSILMATRDRLRLLLPVACGDLAFQAKYVNTTGELSTPEGLALLMAAKPTIYHVANDAAPRVATKTLDAVVGAAHKKGGLIATYKHDILDPTVAKVTKAAPRVATKTLDAVVGAAHKKGGLIATYKHDILDPTVAKIKGDLPGAATDTLDAVVGAATKKGGLIDMYHRRVLNPTLAKVTDKAPEVVGEMVDAAVEAATKKGGLIDTYKEEVLDPTADAFAKQLAPILETLNKLPKRILLCGTGLTGIIGLSKVIVHAINCKISSSFSTKQVQHVKKSIQYN